jgi:aryl-alcohol dehydrogenase-like predicted oxidoreductase
LLFWKSAHETPGNTALRHARGTVALGPASDGAMASAFTDRAFGSTGLTTSALGLGSSPGLPGKEVERAFERGVRFFLWGSLRRRDFARGLRNLAQQNRSEMVVAVQSYTRWPSLMEWSVDRALRTMRTDYVDVLCLAWWNAAPPQRILDAALALREKGKVKKLMISCHHRPAFEGFIANPDIDALMVRYNAAHPGAEREVFPHLVQRRPGMVAFTATRWGTLLDRRYVPAGEETPRPSDCYRFALSSPHIDVCLAAPKNAKQLDDALIALDRGAMEPDELAWMRRVGAGVRDAAAARRRLSPIDMLDRLVSSPCGGLKGPKQLTSG